MWDGSNGAEQERKWISARPVSLVSASPHTDNRALLQELISGMRLRACSNRTSLCGFRLTGQPSARLSISMTASRLRGNKLERVSRRTSFNRLRPLWEHPLGAMQFWDTVFFFQVECLSQLVHRNRGTAYDNDCFWFRFETRRDLPPDLLSSQNVVF